MRVAYSSSGVQLLVVVMAECRIHELAEFAWSCRGLCAAPTGIPWAGGRVWHASMGLLMSHEPGSDGSVCSVPASRRLH